MSTAASQPQRRFLTARQVGGVAVVVLIVLFIGMNRDETSVSFVLFDVQTPLWVALAVAAVGGLLAGLLLGRSHYRR
jgi:uncharacterized integral membrane protein